MSDALISADANKKMFDKIASRYDLTNRLISLGLDRRWRRKAVSLLNPVSDGLYLDIGCGTGDVMQEIIRQAPSSKVIGIDPADNMLEIAKDKFSKADCQKQTDLKSADACSLPFDDSHFQGAISAFCFRNISDRQQALAEAHRVLSSGARLVLLELTVTERKLMAPFYWLFSRLIIPFAGWLTGNRKAYRYLVESIYDFSSNEDLESLMRSAGFTEVSKTELNGGIVSIFVGHRAPSGASFRICTVGI